MKKKLKPIEEQVVVVMGASRGMGRETARRFARRGAKVIVAARGEEGLRSLVEEIQQQGGSATSCVADVTDFAQVKAVADAAITTYGRLDTWVHLVGVSAYGRLDELQPEEFKRVVDVNLTGSAYGAMAALPHLRREGGALILVSSGLGRRAVPLLSAYCASKHGMIGMIDALRVELAHDGVPISVTNVMPSSINTPFFSTARTRMGVKPRPVPPTYDPALAADQILYAAEHPVRDLTVGGAATGLILAQRLVPTRLIDFYLTRWGFGTQKTDEPKSADAPSNLFRPIEGETRVRGDYGQEAHGRSMLNWLQRHPWLRRLMTAGALSALAVLKTRRSEG